MTDEAVAGHTVTGETMKSIFLMAALILSLHATAVAKTPVTWSTHDQPPYYTLDGTGIHDMMVNYLIRHLPDYAHRFIRSNVERALSQLEKKNNAVLLGIYKTKERQYYTLYSPIPLYLNFNTVFVYRKIDIDKIKPFVTEAHYLDIERLILSKKYIIGISKGRMYSGIIDEMIQKYGNTGGFYIRFSEDITAGHMKMLTKNRIDGYFDQPISVKPSARKIGIDESGIASLPIWKMKAYEPVWIGLPKSDWGRKLSQRVIEIMSRKETIETFAGYYKMHIPGSMKEQYDKICREYYLKHHDMTMTGLLPDSAD